MPAVIGKVRQYLPRGWQVPLTFYLQRIIIRQVDCSLKGFSSEDHHLQKAHSSSGLGRRPLKAEVTGSNPVCATKSLVILLFEAKTTVTKLT